MGLEPGIASENHPGVQPSYNENPAWLPLFLQIQGLRRLKFSWTYEESGLTKRNVKIANMMRDKMLRRSGSKGTVGSRQEGIRIRSRHLRDYVHFAYIHFPNRLPPREEPRVLVLEMDIEDGKSRLGPSTRRVKVLPNRRCGDCGRFDATRKEKEACPCEVLGSFLDTQIAETPRFENVNALWKSLTLLESLPPGVTEADFREAETFLAEGFQLEKSEYQAWWDADWCSDYDGSDYGDTDSLLSIQDEDVKE